MAYRKQRKQLINVTTELYEYRPDAATQTALYRDLAPGEPVPHMGLHAKTAVELGAGRFHGPILGVC